MDDPGALLPFLQSHVSLVVASIALVVLIAIRAVATDRQLRIDLRGAVTMFISSIAFRLLGLIAGDQLTGSAAKVVTVLWMVTLAFGLVRTGVSLGLWVLRLRSGKPTPKIVGDVLGVTLYAITAMPILKSELDIDLTGVVATSAILSIVLGLALQDTLGNLFAGIALQLERPFHVGDAVKIGVYTGQVVQIGWRATRIETFRGESIVLPNSILSKEPVQNFTRAGSSAIGIDLELRVSYDTPPTLVKATVVDVLNEIPLVVQNPKPVCRPHTYEEIGIKYQVRYFVADFLTSMDVRDEFLSRLWYRFRRDGIEVPFPQRVVTVRQEQSRKPELPENNLVDLLRSVDLFSSLPRDVHEKLAHNTPVKRFGKGEQVITAGEVGNTFYIVASGELSVKGNRGDAEINRLRRGSYFGEMSLLTGEPRAATVTAMTDCVLLEMDRATFSRLFSDYPNLAKQLSAMLAVRRTQLKAASDVSHAAHASELHPADAGRIFHRLRQIFGIE